MCGRYSLVKLDKARERFSVDIEEFDERRPPLFNVAPTEAAPVLIQRDDKRVLKDMLFGLIPHWAKDAKIASQCINARSESVHEKPAYRDSFRKRRCLVVTDGYFEWKAVDKKTKQPYRVVRKDGDLFALAGVWDTWKAPNGKEVESFSILTTDTNGLTREFHERMPVILGREDESLWLAPYVQEPKTLLPLLKPYPAEEMTLYPVSRSVNKAGNKGPECVEPLKQQQLDL